MVGQGSQPCVGVIRGVLDHLLELAKDVPANAGEVVAPFPAELQDGLQRPLEGRPTHQRMHHTGRGRPMAFLVQALAQDLWLWPGGRRKVPAPARPKLGQPRDGAPARVPDATGLAQVAMTRMPRSLEATPQCHPFPTMRWRVLTSAPALAVYPGGMWWSCSFNFGGGMCRTPLASWSMASTV